MLKRQGIKLNRKKLYRLYKEERLTVRKRGGRKRALGTRAPMAIPQSRNLRWSLDFVTDTLVSGRRFRILTLVDDFTRECLGLVVDTSLTGLRVARELDRIAELRGYPGMLVSELREPRNEIDPTFRFCGSAKGRADVLRSGSPSIGCSCAPMPL